LAVLLQRVLQPFLREEFARRIVRYLAQTCRIQFLQDGDGFQQRLIFISGPPFKCLEKLKGNNIYFRNFRRVVCEATNIGFGQPMFWHAVIIPSWARWKTALFREIVGRQSLDRRHISFRVVKVKYNKIGLLR
jgi:hypothetical protein